MEGKDVSLEGTGRSATPTLLDATRRLESVLERETPRPAKLVKY